MNKYVIFKKDGKVAVRSYNEEEGYKSNELMYTWDYVAWEMSIGKISKASQAIIDYDPESFKNVKIGQGS